MRAVWTEEKQARGEIAAVAARVRACVAGLAAERLEMEQLTAEWGVRLGLPGYGPRPTAKVVPFPSPRLAVVPAAPARRAA